MNKGKRTLASPPHFNILTPGGSFVHVIQFLNYLLVNLVSLQISPGDRITLSTGASRDSNLRLSQAQYSSAIVLKAIKNTKKKKNDLVAQCEVLTGQLS